MSHFTGLRLKHRTLKFRDKNFPKKCILGTEFKKQLSIFEVSGPNLPKKVILATEFQKAIVEFRISTTEYFFVQSFILDNAL